MNMAEIDIYGIYVPTFMVLMLVAYFINKGIRAILQRQGFYTLVWHRSLFDLAIYVLVVGILFYGMQRL